MPGSITKNEKEAVQPLPSWLVRLIAGWHVGQPGALFPKIPGDAAAMVRRDQAGARAAWIAASASASERERREKSSTLVYRTAAGTFDFHALRHYCSTILGQSGASVTERQTLMRHLTPLLTIGTYDHAEAARLRSVVESAFADPTPTAIRMTKGGDGEAHAQSAAR